MVHSDSFAADSCRIGICHYYSTEKLIERTKETVQAEYSDIMIKDLRYGDSFDMIKVADTEGNEATLKYGASHTVLFYLSSSCTGCKDALRFVKRLQSVFGEDNLQVLLLWSDSIPVS